MTDDPGAPGPTGGATEDFSYAYDVHGSVSLLLSNTTSAPDHGAARASCDYSPYGEADTGDMCRARPRPRGRL